jgi:hypothetical protein
MTDKRRQSATTCWECEATTSRPIVVTTELPTGHRLRVQLCPSCYEAYYLPLIVEAGAGEADESPPDPEPAPRSPCADRIHH